MQGYADPATASNMSQASHLDPNTMRMKTVSEFLTSPQPIVPISTAYAPIPSYMVGGSPYPMTPHEQVMTYDRLKMPDMELKTLFGRAFGSAAR